MSATNKQWAHGIRRAGRAIVEATDTLLDQLYPPRCPGCRVRLCAARRRIGSAWCRPCADTVFRLDAPCCRICASPRPRQSGRIYRGVDGVCQRCTERRPSYDTASSLFEYTGAIADAIQYAKYAPAMWPVRPLEASVGPWLSERLDELDELEAPVVATVPMHAKDLSRRGFHLVEMLLRRAARRDPRLRTTRVLTKTRYTPPQAGLTLGERLGNVSGVFEVRDDQTVAARTVVLVDDVMTTGATAQAAARTLIDGGARQVVVFTIARARAR